MQAEVVALGRVVVQLQARACRISLLALILVRQQDALDSRVHCAAGIHGSLQGLPARVEVQAQ